MTIDEDFGRTRVRLSYLDYENDLATQCEVISRADGFVREKFIDGVHFRTRPYDPYASNISIEYIDNGLLPTTVTSNDSGTDRIVQIFYQSTPPTTAADIILAVQSDYKANAWLMASLHGAPTRPVTSHLCPGLL